MESQEVKSEEAAAPKNAQNDLNKEIPITITDSAIEMVNKAIAEEGLENHGLRIAVHGGGCSGLQYALDFTDKKRAGDSVFDVKGLQVYVDMASLKFLQGTTINYVSGLNGTGFKFENPNATRTCGCGHSFS